MTAAPTSPLPPAFLVLAAIPQELDGLLATLPPAPSRRLAGRTFWCGTWAGRPVWAGLSVQGVLFAGVAGGLGPGVAVGDVVVADALLQHDMDASPLFPRYEVPMTGLSRFPIGAVLGSRVAAAAAAVVADIDRVVDPAARAALGLQRPPVLHRGLIVSGDRFVSTATESQALRQALPDALAVEMEGAAVAQVCADFDVPLAVVRTVSDRADDSAHLDFNRFIDTVARQITRAIVTATLDGWAAA